MSSDASLLVGTWKLRSTTRKEVESGEESPAFGPHPTGFLNYSPDGRMMVEGNQVTHHIEVSSDPLRAGVKLIRSINLDGQVLTLTAPPTRYWMGGGLSVVSIVWEKIG